MAEPFPPKIGAPAARALAAAGITSLAELSRWSQPELAALHGVGPKALAVLAAALEANHPPTTPEGPVDAYLAGLDEAPRRCLAALRATLRQVVPNAEEAVRYGMPTVVVDGVAVAGYAAFRRHCGYFPMSGTVLDAVGEALDGYPRSKGGFKFGFDERLPVALVRRLVKLRLAEAASSRSGAGAAGGRRRRGG